MRSRALGRGPLVFLPRFHQAPDFEEPYYGALGWGRVPATGPAAWNFNQMRTTTGAGRLEIFGYNVEFATAMRHAGG